MDFPNNQGRRKAVWGRQCRLPVAVALLTLLIASSAQAQMRVTLEWDRNADPHTLGYMVSAGLSSGNYIAQFNVGTQNRLQLDLPHGGAYYAVVRAYDALGRFGPASPEMVIDLTGPPREPTALRASTSPEHTTLEWNPPASGGSPLAYLVSVGTAPGAVDVLNSYSVGLVHSASGVLPPGVYFARVQAVNLLGAGPPTPDLAFQTGAGLRIQGPTNLSLGWQGANAVLTWTSPGGGPSDAGCLRARGWYRRGHDRRRQHQRRRRHELRDGRCPLGPTSFACVASAPLASPIPPTRSSSRAQRSRPLPRTWRHRARVRRCR